jgi:mannose-6-phosphate isomerase-like protein (cupin superfamily)
MARAGTTIANPVTKERITFLQTAADTNGELLQFDHYMEPGGIAPPVHWHPRQHERFVVVSGKMGILLEGQKRVLEAGQEIVVPPGPHIHTWWNAGDDELHQITEFRPALQFEVYAETNFALGREERVYEGLPLILQYSVLFTNCKENVYSGQAPPPVQRLLLPAVAQVARLFGYRDRYMRYRI